MLKHQSETELKSLKYSFYIGFLSEKQNLRFSSNTTDDAVYSSYWCCSYECNHVASIVAVVYNNNF